MYEQWGPTFKTTFLHISFYKYCMSFSNVLLILEFNICMKQRTEIPINPRGELELLFTFTGITYFVYLVHLVGKKILTFLSKESIHSTLFQNYGLHNT